MVASGSDKQATDSQARAADLTSREARRRLFISGAAKLALPVLGIFSALEFRDGAYYVGSFMALCALLMVLNAWLAQRPAMSLIAPRITLLLCCLVIVVELFHHGNPTTLLFSAIIPLGAIFVFGRVEGVVWAACNWLVTAGVLLVAVELGLPTLEENLLDFNLSYALVLMLTFGYETLQTRASAALQEEQQRLRDFAEVASDWMFELDQDLRFTRVSDRWAESLELPTDQLIGLPLTALRRSLVGDQSSMENFSTRLMDRKPFRDVQFSIQVQDKTYHLTANGQPVTDAEGNFAGYRGTARDITATVADQALLRAKDAELLQAQKMEAIGQLTSGVAHDFNNLLTVINGNLELMQYSMEHDGRRSERVLTKLSAAMQAADRAAELTSKLLSFARRQPLKPSTVDVLRLVRELEDLLRRTLGEQIAIELCGDDELWLCHVDAGLLESALLNLAINARDAMTSGGTLTICCRNRQLTSQAGLDDGDYVEIEVEDSGRGIPADVVPHVFEPFFTTKAPGEGSGLGLSMVYGFAEQSGGRATLTSEEGTGTTVTISLPRFVGQEQSSDNPLMLSRVLTPRRVLVVEDETDVRELVSAMAKTLGHEVRSARNASDALQTLEQWQPQILVTDVILSSGPTGPQLAEQALERFPDLRVLLISGYPEHAFDESGELSSRWPLLKKPFGREALRDALGDLYANEGAGSTAA